MTRTPGRLLVAVVASATLLVAPAAHAAVVPIDPGPVAAGKPIWGTRQNLPPMTVTSTYTVGPTNAAAIESYYGSGQNRRDQHSVIKAARTWIYSWIDERCDGRPKSCDATVVFDIDETLLSNYGYYKQTDFVYEPDSWNAFNEACKNAPIAPSVKLYRQLKRDGVQLVLITGRPEADRSWTAPCLRKNGVSGWHELILRSNAEASLSADVYKSQRRAALQREGHRIVASIGDQISDMSGGHLKAGFLLPNVIYFIP